jgi:UDP-N-acetylglucosamine diphosphorylase / glucose-1-phosphate thymidylyltransferase / UDP-N-acetylgalactosamine diphosphorylase / glucosamine-1-phosphate N-acetyltransferase / galactosamine-1-phosphate N-acetyltransferase
MLDCSDLAFPASADYGRQRGDMTTAVVLAAGRGTRMGVLTAATPKSLLAVAGRPIIEHVLGGFAAAGVRRAVVVTGYRGDAIEAALGNGARLGMEIAYRRQEHADGTARAVLLAEALVGGAPFALSWGDVLVPRGFYAELIEAFARRPCDAQVAVNEVDDPWRGAAVYVGRDGRVERLVEKPAAGTSTTHWNNAGVLMLTALVFDYARRLPASPRGEYELPQALAQMVRDGCDVRAVPVRGPLSDVCTPEDLHAAQELFAAPPGDGR